MAAAEQFRNRRWRGRRQVQESESVACTRKCHGYAVGGVDGAEALRGCTLRRACASVSKWRASELCRDRKRILPIQAPLTADWHELAPQKAQQKEFCRPAGKEFSTKGGRTKRFTRQARQEKNWNPENEESTRRDGCAEKKKNICQTPFKGRVSRVLRYTLGAASPARSAFGAARRRRTAFTTRGVKRRRSHFVPRIGLRSPTHETAIAVRVQHVLLCTRRALNAARSAARAA